MWRVRVAVNLRIAVIDVGHNARRLEERLLYCGAAPAIAVRADASPAPPCPSRTGVGPREVGAAEQAGMDVVSDGQPSDSGSTAGIDTRSLPVRRRLFSLEADRPPGGGEVRPGTVEFLLPFKPPGLPKAESVVVCRDQQGEFRGDPRREDGSSSGGS